MDETTERPASTHPRLASRSSTLAPAELRATVASSPFAPSLATPPVATSPRLGRYAILRHLGSGGMGSVHLAYDEELHRRVAIKLLHDLGDDAHARARMLREAQALARLSHPNVVQIHDIGEHAGRIFMAMEFVEGTTLRAWRDETRPGIDAIREKYLQAGRGLAAAHAAGLAHRDFKADNAVLGADGRVRVLDFGLARAELDAREPPVPEDMSQPFAAELTRLGARVGTPAYMSPEQFRGATADARSDQFSFCAALYEAFYGQRPFAGDTIDELDHAVAEGTVRSPPPDVELPPRLHQALLRGLARDPAARWPTMEPLLAVLAVDLRSDPIATPRLRRRLIALWAVAFVLVQLIVLALGVAGSEHLTPAAHRDEGLVIWLVLVIISLATHRVLRDHTHHLAVLRTFLIGVTGMTVARVLQVPTGAGLRTMVVTDLLILATTLALGAVLLAPWLRTPAAVGVALALAVTLAPTDATHLVPVVYPIIDIVLLAGWAHASRLRSPAPV